MNNKPLITFALVAYNQEKFIHEALLGAFTQTYKPLEIILSDDCSSDRTFEIMKELAGNYSGPHKVILNRNNSNMGIGAHINRMIELANGELIVAAAADDVSLPKRTEVIYQAWEESGRQALGIFSSFTMITGDGTEKGTGGTRGDPDDHRVFRRLDGDWFRFLSTRDPMVNGCTAAWSRKLISYFGSVRADLEDVVLSFRTLAIGQLFYIHQPLVKYRRDVNNVSFFRGEVLRSFEHREKRLRWGNETTVRTYENLIADIGILCEKGRISPAERDRLQAEAKRILKPYRVEGEMMDGRSMLERVRTLTATALRGDIRCALRSVPRALPQPIYRALYLIRAKWQYALQSSADRQS
jgi:glycosyltransferase involved in cell wall biosynthesis